MKPQTQTGINSNVRDYLNREFNAFIKPEKTMPCGSRHSCFDCRHYASPTDPCTHIERMSEDEYDEFVNKTLNQ